MFDWDAGHETLTRGVLYYLNALAMGAPQRNRNPCAPAAGMAAQEERIKC